MDTWIVDQSRLVNPARTRAAVAAGAWAATAPLLAARSGLSGRQGLLVGAIGAAACLALGEATRAAVYSPASVVELTAAAMSAQPDGQPEPPGGVADDA